MRVVGSRAAAPLSLTSRAFTPTYTASEAIAVQQRYVHTHKRPPSRPACPHSHAFAKSAIEAALPRHPSIRIRHDWQHHLHVHHAATTVRRPPLAIVAQVRPIAVMCCCLAASPSILRLSQPTRQPLASRDTPQSCPADLWAVEATFSIHLPALRQCSRCFKRR